MRITSIRVKEDLKRRLNKLKFDMDYKSVDSVIRRLMEIASKIKTADNLSAENNNTTKTKVLPSGLKTTNSGGVSNQKGEGK